MDVQKRPCQEFRPSILAQRRQEAFHAGIHGGVIVDDLRTLPVLSLT